MPQVNVRERLLKSLLRSLSFLYFLGLLGLVAGGPTGPLRPLLGPLGYAFAIISIGTLALVAFLASGDVHRYRALVPLFVWASLLLTLGAALALARPEAIETVQL